MLLEDCSSVAAAVIVHTEYVQGKLPPVPSHKAIKYRKYGEFPERMRNIGNIIKIREKPGN